MRRVALVTSKSCRVKLAVPLKKFIVLAVIRIHDRRNVIRETINATDIFRRTGSLTIDADG